MYTDHHIYYVVCSSFIVNYHSSFINNQIGSNNKDWSCRKMGAISDEDLTKIGVAIGNDSGVAKLAIRLGFSFADAKSCRNANRDNGNNTCTGTQLLLSNWKKTTDAEEQSTKLRKALEDSGLKQISNIFLPKQSKRKRASRAKKEPVEGCSNERTVKKQKITAIELTANTIEGDQQGAPATKEEPQTSLAKTEPQTAPQAVPVLKEEQQWAPSIKEETQAVPAKMAPKTTPAKATPKARPKATKGAPQLGAPSQENKKKKEKGGASLEAKQKELEKEEKALKKFERGVKKSEKSISKLKAAIFKMEETERIQLEKTLAETKAKLNKLGGTPK